MSSRKFLLATAAVIAVIVHGSLYPYEFRVPASPIGPIATLLRSWAVPPSSYGDLVANVLLYAPLGFFGALALHTRRGRRVVVMALVGLVLSVAIELAQFYDAGRVTNMSDVYLNTSGAVLGAIAAAVLTDAGRHLPTAEIVANPIPALLLAAMLGYHLFPYVPTIDLHKYWHALRPLLFAPSLSRYELLHYTALWLTTSCLVGAIVGYRRSRLLVPLLVGFVFAGKIMIETLVLPLPELVGAALAVALWFAVGESGRVATVLAAVVLAGLIVATRLEPFHFEASARAFGWLPFRAFLNGSLRINTVSFLEKFFLYGSLVWLVSEIGLPLWLATLLVASMLFATSLAERYIPGRSAEITDALMVLIIGLVMAPMRVRAR